MVCDRPMATPRPGSRGLPIFRTLWFTRRSRNDGHPGYATARAGDPDAALTLAVDLLDGAAIETLRSAIAGHPALLLPVIADGTGFNLIPDAMAQVLGRDLDLPVIAGEIFQTNKVGHEARGRGLTPAV